MKRKLLKNYLKLGILLFGISIFVIACQKDDTITKEEQSLDTETPTITTVAYEQAGATFNQLKSTLKIERFLKSRYAIATDLQAKSTQDTLGLTILRI